MINPIALKLGPVSIHWYGIAYVVALGFGIWILARLNKEQKGEIVCRNGMILRK